MAHFAKINNDNVVEEIIVIDNNNAQTEQLGKDFILSIGLEGNWIQTSYNNNFRYKFAAVGDIYDSVNDRFVISESLTTSYKSPWGGTVKPSHQSIIFDATARSANIWTIEVLHQAFPNAFQRWGYLEQHNPLTFEKDTHGFGCVATVIRNPIDLIASQIVMFKTNTSNNREVYNLIQKNIDILDSIYRNKNNVTIFSFETATTDPETLVSVVSNMLEVDPEPYNKEVLVENIQQFTAGHEGFYSLPIDNQDELDSIKTFLQQERFADLLAKANDLYSKLLVYKEA